MTPEKEKQLFDTIQVINERQKRMLIVLVGDEEMKTEGISQRVDRHGKRISSLESDRSKVIGGVVAGSTLFGVISAWITHKFFS